MSGGVKKDSTMTSSNHNDSGDPNLVRRTLRTVGLLVTACVIFVGVLSVLAVAITSRAVNGGAGAQATEAPAAAAKKPLSI